jgi:hypothetical protein
MFAFALFRSVSLETEGIIKDTSMVPWIKPKDLAGSYYFDAVRSN